MAESALEVTGAGKFPLIAIRIVELLVGALFIYAGVLKAFDPLGFANDIDNYKILPWSFGVRLAFFLPWLEVICGLTILVRRYYRGGLAILISLMSVFIAASVIAKARGLDVSCGCFGHAGRNLSFAGHLLLDVAILAALLVLGWVRLRRNRDRVTA
jgi:uncharacterized membrane protein YphA (DoxX/SURF4 family)